MTEMGDLGRNSRGRAQRRSPCRELPDPFAVLLREPLLLALGGRLGGLLGWLRFRFGHCYASSFAYAPGFHAKV
jgi:hypothetical protein